MSLVRDALIHVFGLWVEPVRPGKATQAWGEHIKTVQTPQRKGPVGIQTTDLLTMRL